MNATAKKTALQNAKAEIAKEGIKLSNMCDPSDCRVAMRELIKIQKRHGLMGNKGLNALYLNICQKHADLKSALSAEDKTADDKWEKTQRQDWQEEDKTDYIKW